MKITCHVSVSDFTPNVHTIATSTLRMNTKKHPIKTHSFSDPLKKYGDIYPKTDFFSPSIRNFIHHVWFCSPFVCIRNVDWRDLYADYGTFKIYLFRNIITGSAEYISNSMCIRLLCSFLLLQHFHHSTFQTSNIYDDGFPIKKDQCCRLSILSFWIFFSLR